MHASTSIRKRLSITLLFSIVATAAAVFHGGRLTIAKADPKPTECYRIQSPTPDTASGAAMRAGVWCYRELENPVGARLVYGIDDHGTPQPELSVMIEPDGTIRHASLAAGKLTVHRVRARFSPIGVPLTPPSGAERVSPPGVTTSSDEAEGGLKLLWDYADVDVHVNKVSEGTSTAAIPTENLPWRGYWFPYSSGRLHNGSDSPLAKYDRFVSRRADGANLGAQSWEKTNHAYRGIGWDGHCNGWAAASVLTKEPTKPITDPFSNTTFGVNDLKGLLIVRNYCPKTAFYGSRNDGPNAGPTVSAGTFHNVLTYFIGELKKPVLMDLLPGPEVMNSVISGYSMSITKTGANSYYVVATLTVHKYDEAPSDDPGVAPSEQRQYAYNLVTTPDGEVKYGSWAMQGPDFIWVPVAQGDCAERNVSVDQFWLDEIFKFQK